MKFKKKPKIFDEIEKEKKAQAIIEAVDQVNTNNAVLKKEKPWKLIADPSIKDVTTFSFRIPREEMMKLKYISGYEMISINALCLVALRQYLRKELKNIEK